MGWQRQRSHIAGGKCLTYFLLANHRLLEVPGDDRIWFFVSVNLVEEKKVKTWESGKLSIGCSAATTILIQAHHLDIGVQWQQLEHDLSINTAFRTTHKTIQQSPLEEALGSMMASLSPQWCIGCRGRPQEELWGQHTQTSVTQGRAGKEGTESMLEHWCSQHAWIM